MFKGTKLLKDLTKEEQKYYHFKRGNVYNKNIGIYDNQLNHVINMNIQNKKILKTKLLKIYHNLNIISAKLMNRPETEYVVYYFSEKHGRTFRKVISDTDEFINSFSVQRSLDKKKNKYGQVLQGDTRKIQKLFSDDDIDINFDQHFSLMREHMEQDFEIANKQRKRKNPYYINQGFLAEVFEAHVELSLDKWIDDKLDVKDSPSTSTEWFANNENLFNNYFIQIGNARFTTGGDILNRQLKSITDKSAFNVTTLTQLQVSLKMIEENLKPLLDDEQRDELTPAEAKNLFLFFNDFHEGIIENVSADMENKLESRVQSAIQKMAKRT